jgi:hypothetical protein
MLATIITMILALALSLGMCLVPGFETMLVYSKTYFEFFFGGCFVLSLLPWIAMLFLSQGNDAQPIAIAALRSNLADKKIYAYSVSIEVVSLIGMLVVFQSIFSPIWSFVGAVLCGGILLDLFRKSYWRLQFRRTPEGIVEWFIEVMMESAKRGDEEWHTISFEVPFGLMMVYMRNGAYGSLRLFCSRINALSDLWLGSIARLSMYRTPRTFEESLLDRFSSAEVMTSKRIAWVIQESCSLGSLPGLEEITRLAGKLFISFHSHHESLGSLLLLALSQATQKDSGKIRLWDLDREILSTFSEVIKSLIERSMNRKTLETASILNVLSILENTVRGILRSEKSISPVLLMQPFVETSLRLEHDRYRSLRGRDEILVDLRRILAQFSVFEGVTYHPVEGGGEATDTKASFKEDLPFTSHRQEERQS